MAIYLLGRRSFFYPEIRKSGNPEIQISGNPDIRKSGFLQKSCGCLVVYTDICDGRTVMLGAWLVVCLPVKLCHIRKNAHHCQNDAFWGCRMPGLKYPEMVKMLDFRIFRMPDLKCTKMVEIMDFRIFRRSQ